MSDHADSSSIRDRYRIRFAKTGLLRWIGHRDLQRLWERLLRRRELKLSMTEGFHPKPRISFPSALALGIEGLDEVVEIELTQSVTPDRLRKILVADDQPGLTIGSVDLVCRLRSDGSAIDSTIVSAKARVHSCRYEITIPESISIARVDDAILDAKRKGTLKVDRKEKTVLANIATSFPVFERREQTLLLTQVDSSGPTLKPTDVLDAIGLEDLISAGGTIRRTRVILTDETEQLSQINSRKE